MLQDIKRKSLCFPIYCNYYFTLIKKSKCDVSFFSNDHAMILFIFRGNIKAPDTIEQNTILKQNISCNHIISLIQMGLV